MTATPALAAALVAAAKELTNPAKTRTASLGQFSYTYADLSEVLDHVRPVLAKHDLVVTQDACMEDNRICVYTDVRHASGESLRFGPLSGPIGNSWQNVGSAITYARRYALLSALGLAAEDDDGRDAGKFAKNSGPKPVASDADLKRWAETIRDATQFVELKSIADEINAHHVNEDDKQQLLDEWVAKRQEVDHG